MTIITEQNPVGAVIKIKRKIKGLKMQEFADMLGISLDALNRIESGERSVNFMNTVKYLNTLGYDVVVKKQKEKL